MKRQVVFRRMFIIGLLSLAAVPSDAANPLIRYAVRQSAYHPVRYLSADRQSVVQQSGNLLTNPGFEAPYVKQCCHAEPGLEGLPLDEVQAALGWRAGGYPPGLDA